MTATPASGTTGAPASGSAAADPGSGPGDGLVRAGGIVFLIGAVATLVTVAPLFLHTKPFPTAAYLVCMLMAVGFVLAAAGVLRSIGAQRRQATSFSASVSAPGSPSVPASDSASDTSPEAEAPAAPRA
ncbi:hypothetical protein AB0910_08970 [Streptomyces sp. NPDC047002]|uniref:hypothetical protein n=1 Tax=Streptomyces sp. NPDC047002 TaxID=3155475 RepID=UPI0034518AA3